MLIEDVPGTGKTTLAATLAAVCGLKYKRAQFTPDVMASDITGFNMYNRQKESFEFVEGLAMCNIMLADEINRASPKTQSALLEAMEEGNVTVDGKSYPLPDPFFVVATQNPSGFVGTYPLPEAQLDRFSVRLSLGYPQPSEEVRIISERRGRNPIDDVRRPGPDDAAAIREQRQDRPPRKGKPQPESADEADADGEAEEGRKKRYPHQKAPKNLSTDQFLEKLKESDGAQTAVPREHRRRRNRGPKPEEERGEEAIAEQAPEEA